jgi:hypothetical protein
MYDEIFCSWNAIMISKTEKKKYSHFVTEDVRLSFNFILYTVYFDRLCGLVVRVPGYRSRGPSSIPGATRFSEK